MMTSKEKERIIKKYLKGESITKLSNEYGCAPRPIYRWVEKYQKDGIKGLESQTGKKSHTNPNAGLYLRKPKNKIEELEIEIMKKDIEIARLKKGYVVKGVGASKEYVITLDKNTK